MFNNLSSRSKSLVSTSNKLSNYSNRTYPRSNWLVSSRISLKMLSSKMNNSRKKYRSLERTSKFLEDRLNRLPSLRNRSQLWRTNSPCARTNLINLRWLKMLWINRSETWRFRTTNVSFPKNNFRRTLNPWRVDFNNARLSINIYWVNYPSVNKRRSVLKMRETNSRDKLKNWMKELVI